MTEIPDTLPDFFTSDEPVDITEEGVFDLSQRASALSCNAGDITNITIIKYSVAEGVRRNVVLVIMNEGSNYRSMRNLGVLSPKGLTFATNIVTCVTAHGRAEPLNYTREERTAILRLLGCPQVEPTSTHASL